MGQLSQGGDLTLLAVADTHAVIWYIFGDSRLSLAAKEFIEATAAAGDQVGFSTITLAEIVYLTERGRIREGTLDRLLSVIGQDGAVLLELPFDRHIAEALRRVDRAQVPLISRDHKIRLSDVETLW
jgi:PIN domain nuclease of toxin-antitoxin system